VLNHSCHPRNPSACAGGGGGSAWDAWARGALAAALAAAPLDLSAMWAVAVRYGVHGLLHAGGGGGGGAGAAPAPEGASLGMTPAPNPSPGLGPLLELVAAPVPAGAPEHTRALYKIHEWLLSRVPALCVLMSSDAGRCQARRPRRSCGA
jgi:hypothetical protein